MIFDVRHQALEQSHAKNAIFGAIVWMAAPAWLGMCFIFGMMKAGVRSNIALMNEETVSALVTFDFLDGNRWLLVYSFVAFAAIGGLLNGYGIRPGLRISFFLFLAAPIAILGMQLAYLGGKLLEFR